ncbi:MAG TPA: hemolysin family protein [Victivallales bacterium]|nr:hemolysin family protein [Victivallales bacterium]
MAIIYNHFFVLLNLLILIILSAFFSGTETAYFSLTKHQLSKIKTSKTRISKIIISLHKTPSKFLVAILFGNLTVNILFFCLSTVLIMQIGQTYGHLMQIIFGLIALVIIILFGEILPKSVGINYPITYAMLSCYPIFIWVKVSTPFRFIITIITDSLFPCTKAQISKDITVDELKMLISLSEDEGKIEPQISDIIEDIITLSNLRIKNIMIPRVDMIQANIKSSIDNLINLAIEKNIYDISIYQKDKDNPIGFVNIKDLYFNDDEKFITRKDIPITKFVPETKTAGELLSEMLLEQIKSVYIVDEYGGLSGYVTTNLILKELIGNFYYNPESSYSRKIEKLSESSFKVRGSFPLIAWKDFFKNEIDPSVSLNAASIGGLITFSLDKIPKVGDSITINNVKFSVEKMNGNRVETAILTIH